MSIEIKVPALGESITEATVAKWLKSEGESFEIDEPLVEIETDKITLEVSAPSSGVLKKIQVNEGSDVKVGGVLGVIDENKKNEEKILNNEKNLLDSEKKDLLNTKEKEIISKKIPKNIKKSNLISPSVKKIIAENNIDLSEIISSRDDGRITKGDVLNHIELNSKNTNVKNELQVEESVPMSRIRKTISIKLKNAQNTAAILTTFNEVDMSNIIKVREAKKVSFEKNNGIKLGYMSFFVKAVTDALKEFPAVNAEIRDEKIVYKNYFNIGIAVGSEKGLVVPVLKNADKLSFTEIEKKIITLSSKAKNGKLSIEDLSDGTFTISNGGIYGSMLSTPIINYPQSGILGMHNIKKRALVVEDKIEIRPVMYLAFSYDHRLIDGREAVSFLVLIKKLLEDPSKIILNI